jgi:hypothetical protein
MQESPHGKPHAIPQLSAAERLFIWGFRSIAQNQRLRWPTAAEIRQVYDHFHVGDAVPSLEALLEAFACTAHTAIELHFPTCPCVSPGEHRLMQAVSAAQSERIDAARGQLEYWLPPVATDWALAPTRGIATIFRMAGLMLPDRNARPLDHGRTMAMKSWPIGSPTLH